MPFNIFDGSSWNPLKKLKIHDGSAWKEATAIYVFDGSQWKKTGSKPTNTVIPSLTVNGRFTSLYAMEPGNTLTVDKGTWTDMDGSVATYAYQWEKRRIDQGTQWQTISGATNTTLTLTEDLAPFELKYVAYQLRCKVTATNQYGTNNPLTPVYTAETGFVSPAPLTSVTATVTSNDIVEFTWIKPIGATDFYVQYQGPDVAFTEISSLVNNTDASKGVYTTVDNSAKLTVDFGSADGSLGSLFNPKWVSPNGLWSITGYGVNANVNDLKLTKASVTSSSSNITTMGFTFNWQLNNGITPTSWILYDGDTVVDTYFMNGVNATSYSITRYSAGGAIYGDYWIKVYGSAPRHKQTYWESTPRISVQPTVVPTPVNTIAPQISSSNGRLFSSTSGIWTNLTSVYNYIYTWYSNGTAIWFANGSTLDLGTNTDYDNTTITCKVSCLTTDLVITSESPSSNSITASPYITQYAAYVECDTTTKIYRGAYGSSPATSGKTYITGNVSSNTLSNAQIVAALGIPTSCQQTANTTLYYAYCQTDGSNSNGISTGLQSTTGWSTCSSLYTSLHGTGDIKSGWSCFTNSTSVVVPTCGSTMTAANQTWFCTTAVQGYGCGYTTAIGVNGNTTGSGSGYSTSCVSNRYDPNATYPICPISSTPPATPPAATPPAATPPASLPACTGTITNATAYTCAELGRTLLGNSSNYSISSGQQCCGDLIAATPPVATPPATPPATSYVYYAYCADNGYGGSVSTGLVQADSWSTCSAAYTAIHGTGDIKSGWSCSTSSSSVVVPTCGAATPPAATPPAATPPAATPPAATPPAATPPAALDCLACVGWGSYGPYTYNVSCGDACGNTYTICRTAIGCSDYAYTQCPACNPATPPAATPPAATPPAATPPAATPPAATPPTPPTSGGGGCIVGSTSILTPNGFIQAKDIKVGDVVSSVRFEELSTDETAYSLDLWSSISMTPIETLETKIKSIKIEKPVDSYISINEDLFSGEHKILINKNGIYKFIEVKDIVIGDLVFKQNGTTLDTLEWVPVQSIQNINENATVYLFDTEDDDVLFTKGMLTHNIKAI